MAFRVLIVDDSMLVRQIVGDVLRRIPDVEVVGEARNGKIGLELLESLKPDLVILDIEMPVLDGLSMLEEKRKLGNKTPVMMLSSLTQAGAHITMQALESGAMEFVPKPAGDTGIRLEDLEHQIETKVTGLVLSLKEKSSPPPKPSKGLRLQGPHKLRLALIGASTGGPQSLQEIFTHIASSFPLPIVVVQHMPPIFTAAFAQRLNRVSGLTVFEAESGQVLLPGHAYVAPGGKHLDFQKKGDALSIIVDGESPPLNAHRPSVDFTLHKAIDHLAGEILAVIMTGMGRDGVEALVRLHEAGGVVLAQDEASSIVYGMNRRAIEAGAVDEILPLKELAGRMVEISARIQGRSA
ncbi:MAG: chemotaxis response regulator protein-glutamate methylesterase [Leptospiraceae bacterium]|nr:chemotaxis response regulator protein-glutamate methylesterase [Leptospiraceae bacterium]MCB1303626.1 chemotaxis response regulator protein-glutamate methylesterase [Leptospiraceae bacterium]